MDLGFALMGGYFSQLNSEQRRFPASYNFLPPYGSNSSFVTTDQVKQLSNNNAGYSLGGKEAVIDKGVFDIENLYDAKSYQWAELAHSDMKKMLGSSKYKSKANDSIKSSLKEVDSQIKDLSKSFSELKPDIERANSQLLYCQKQMEELKDQSGQIIDGKEGEHQKLADEGKGYKREIESLSERSKNISGKINDLKQRKEQLLTEQKSVERGNGNSYDAGFLQVLENNIKLKQQALGKAGIAISDKQKERFERVQERRENILSMAGKDTAMARIYSVEDPLRKIQGIDKTVKQFEEKTSEVLYRWRARRHFLNKMGGVEKDISKAESDLKKINKEEGLIKGQQAKLAKKINELEKIKESTSQEKGKEITRELKALEVKGQGLKSKFALLADKAKNIKGELGQLNKEYDDLLFQIYNARNGVGEFDFHQSLRETRNKTQAKLIKDGQGISEKQSSRIMASIKREQNKYSLKGKDEALEKIEARKGKDEIAGAVYAKVTKNDFEKVLDTPKYIKNASNNITKDFKEINKANKEAYNELNSLESSIKKANERIAKNKKEVVSCQEKVESEKNPGKKRKLEQKLRSLQTKELLLNKDVDFVYQKVNALINERGKLQSQARALEKEQIRVSYGLGNSKDGGFVKKLDGKIQESIKMPDDLKNYENKLYEIKTQEERKVTAENRDKNQHSVFNATQIEQGKEKEYADKVAGDLKNSGYIKTATKLIDQNAKQVKNEISAVKKELDYYNKKVKEAEKQESKMAEEVIKVEAELAGLDDKISAVKENITHNHDAKKEAKYKKELKKLEHQKELTEYKLSCANEKSIVVGEHSLKFGIRQESLESELQKLEAEQVSLTKEKENVKLGFGTNKDNKALLGLQSKILQEKDRNKELDKTINNFINAYEELKAADPENFKEEYEKLKIKTANSFKDLELRNEKDPKFLAKLNEYRKGFEETVEKFDERIEEKQYDKESERLAGIDLSDEEKSAEQEELSPDLDDGGIGLDMANATLDGQEVKEPVSPMAGAFKGSAKATGFDIEDPENPLLAPNKKNKQEQEEKSQEELEQKYDDPHAQGYLGAEKEKAPQTVEEAASLGAGIANKQIGMGSDVKTVQMVDEKAPKVNGNGQQQAQISQEARMAISTMSPDDLNVAKEAGDILKQKLQGSPPIQDASKAPKQNVMNAKEAAIAASIG